MFKSYEYRIGIKVTAVVVTFIIAMTTAQLIFVRSVQAVSCSSNATTQNGIQVVPSHGQAFYVDTGTTPKLDAGYVGYQVVNKTGSTKNNLWTELSDFSGNVISLSNQDDSMMQLASITNNSTSTAYFLLKATGATTNAQAHTLKVYDGRPDVSGNSPLYTCTFSFSAVKETLTAGSNSISSITASNTSPSLGQTVVVTVNGSTGTIGNGSAPDNDMIWLAPAAVSSWPTRALRLESVSITFTRNPTSKTYNNRLFFNSADLAGNGSQSNTYVATYTFRVIGRPLGTVKVLPVAQISSGTQVKHANISGAVDITFPSFTVSASVTKTVTATTSLQTTNINGTDYVGVPYRIQITSSTSTAISIDEIVDIPATGTIFKTSSASTTDLTRSGVSIADPVYLASEEGESPRPYHFVGPFTFSSLKSATLDYVMWVPAGSTENIAYSKTGDLIVGATPSSISKVVVTSDGSASIEAATSTQVIEPTAITQTVTSITSTGAMLNGTIDPHGSSPLTATFEYSTNSNLSGSVSVTATTPASGDVSGGTVPTNVSVALTGLSINTTYYYRVKAGNVAGDTLSFSTLAVQATPTVSVQAASNISLTQATLNGSINPNLTTVSALQFIYGTNSSLSSGNITLTFADPDTANGATQLGGSSLQTFSTTTGALIGGTTYYFKLRACTASTGSYPNITCTTPVDSSIFSFVAAGAPNASTTNATSVGASVATLNGVVQANYADTTTVFTYGTSPTLSSGTQTVSSDNVTGSASTTVSTNITGLTPATTYYFRLSGSNSISSTISTILSFITSAVNRTIQIDNDSYESTYSFADNPPILTAIPSDGAGTKTYSSFTTSVCTVNSSSGAVTFLSAGTCTVGASIAADESWSDASSQPVSFTVTAVSRTISINSVALSASYAYDASAPLVTMNAFEGGGSVAYESDSPAICSIDVSTGAVTFVTIGTCTISASVLAGSGYESATASPVSFIITALSRTLTIDSYDSSYYFSDTSPTLTTTASVGVGTVTYSSADTSICTINSLSGKVTFISTGTCSIDASIASNGVYASASASRISFLVTSDPVPPTITLRGVQYVVVYIGSTYSDEGAIAVDHGGVNLTSSIVQSNNVNVTQAGSYAVRFNVSDGVGVSGQEVARYVTVVPPESTRSTMNTASTTAIFIPSSVEDATLDISAFKSGTSATISATTTITATSTKGTVYISIPPNITMTSAGVSWDGVINLPQGKTSSEVNIIPSSGKTASFVSAVEVGLGNTAITFDRAVRILFADQANKLVGWTRGSDFTPVTDTCVADNQAMGDALASASDCKISVGTDLVVWTKHFTTYVIYTETSESGDSISSSTTFLGSNGPISDIFRYSYHIGTTSTLKSIFHFTRNLKLGSIHDEVKRLQQFLNNLGFVLGTKGVGSPGNETNYFGPLTKKALIKFQETYASEILIPQDLLSGTGNFFEYSKKKANKIIDEQQ